MVAGHPISRPRIQLTRMDLSSVANHEDYVHLTRPEAQPEDVLEAEAANEQECVYPPPLQNLPCLVLFWRARGLSLEAKTDMFPFFFYSHRLPFSLLSFSLFPSVAGNKKGHSPRSFPVSLVFSIFFLPFSPYLFPFPSFLPLFLLFPFPPFHLLNSI